MVKYEIRDNYNGDLVATFSHFENALSDVKSFEEDWPILHYVIVEVIEEEKILYKTRDRSNAIHASIHQADHTGED